MCAVCLCVPNDNWQQCIFCFFIYVANLGWVNDYFQLLIERPHCLLTHRMERVRGTVENSEKIQSGAVHLCFIQFRIILQNSCIHSLPTLQQNSKVGSTESPLGEYIHSIGFIFYFCWCFRHRFCCCAVIILKRNLWIQACSLCMPMYNKIHTYTYNT